jgi:aspartyl/glutamyl-tRNA(Asn/Gln) amidotransferase C subunit
MPLSPGDVLRLAREARLAIGAAEAEVIARELAPVLDGIERLGQVDAAGLDPVDGVGAAGMPLRADAGPPMAMDVGPDHFAPEWRDGHFIVPPAAPPGPPAPGALRGVRGA